MAQSHTNKNTHFHEKCTVQTSYNCRDLIKCYLPGIHTSKSVVMLSSGTIFHERIIPISMADTVKLQSSTREAHVCLYIPLFLPCGYMYVRRVCLIHTHTDAHTAASLGDDCAIFIFTHYTASSIRITHTCAYMQSCDRILQLEPTACSPIKAHPLDIKRGPQVWL